MINGLDNVHYMVSDVKRTVEFYTNILGLEVVDQDEHWATISLKGIRLGLHKVTSSFFAKPIHGGATVTLSVTDIDEAYEALKAKGVKFNGEISRNPWGSHVSFCDPDGNFLDLRQAPKN